MSYSFSLSRMRAVRVYAPLGAEASRPDDGVRASLEQALRQYPDLKNLKISDDAKLARAKIIFKLEQAKSNGGADYTKWYSGDDVKGLFLQNIDVVIKALQTGTDFSPIISSYLGDGKTDRIKPLGSAPTMTYRTFLMRFTQDANLVARATSEGVTSSVEKDPEALRQKSRLEKVLKAFEEKHPEKEYKNTLLQAHMALINPDTQKGIRTALEILNGNTTGLVKIKNLSDEFNIDFAAAIGTDATMEKTLRAIGDTQSAGKEMLKRFSETDLKDWKDSKIPTQKSLYNKLYDVNGSPKSIPDTHMKLAIAKYDQMLRDTNQRDPEYPILLAQKNQIIAGSAQIMFLDEVVTAHIRENGDKNLTTVLKSFNEMKGIHGLMNFSDENAKMTKEIGIMIGSMVLTAGASSLLAGAAVAVRTGAVAVRGAQAANTSARAEATVGAVVTMDRARGVGSLVQSARSIAAAPLNVTASALKGASSGLRWVEGAAGSRGIGFMVEGVKFTTVHAGLTSYFRGEGEKSGFNNFLGQLGMNTLMFGAFHGMEKFVTGPTASRMVAKFGLQDAKIAAFTVNNITYSLGDVAVMHALHAAETGKVEFDTKSLFESLAYRVAFGVGPQGLTKLKEQFPNQTKKFEAAYGSITSPKEWMEKLKKKNPAIAEGVPQGSFHAGDEMARGARLEPAGKNVAQVPSPERRSERVKNVEFVPLKNLNLDTLTRGTTLSFTHPGNQTYSAGEVVLKMLGNGQARVVSLPKGDRQGTMDYGLKNGDTINVSVTSDGQNQFLNLNHPKNGNTSLIMNDVGAVRIQGPVAKTQKPTESTTAKNTPEAPLDANKVNTQIKDMKMGETVTVTTENNTYKFAKIEGERFMLIETTNPNYKPLIGKPEGVSTSIQYGADGRFVATGIFPYTSTVKNVSFEKPENIGKSAESQPLRLAWNGKPENTSQRIIGPNDAISVQREALLKRKAELEKFKQENPGNITRDADLLRTERALTKLDEILTPEFFSNIQGLVGKPHKEFVSSIEGALSKGEFPRFPGKDGYVWTIRKIESGKGAGKEQVTIGELGSGQEMVVSMRELKNTINTNIKKYLDWQKQYGSQADLGVPAEKPKRNQVTEAFFKKLGGYEVPKDLSVFVTSLRDVLKSQKFPQYPGGDGLIYTIRSVGNGPDPLVTVGVLGRKKTEQVRASELREHIDVEIVNYREGMKDIPLPRTDIVPTTVLPTVPKDPAGQVDVGRKPEGNRNPIVSQDANGRPIDKNPQAPVEAVNAGPRDIQQRTNLERSIAKTRTDIDTMKRELRDMENSTGAYHRVAPNPEAIAKQRADIARAEKHLSSLNAALRDLFPLRQSRREAQEYLRAERQKLIDMSPEARRAELARIQTEGKELIGRKGDLEKKLEADKDKITWDERRAIEKDIEELGKKIDANKRQENMVKRADAIALKLRENGIDPKAAAAGLGDPQKRKELGENLDKIKSQDKGRWLLLLGLLLALGAFLWSRSGDENTPPPEVNPALPSGPQLDAVCGEQSNVEKPKLEYIRQNDQGIELTEDVRTGISRRFMEISEWKAVIDLFRANETLFEASKFADAFNAMLRNPSPTGVQHIQQWIGMESKDAKTGQDGILGPITANAIKKFINTCKNSNSNGDEREP